MVSLRPYIATSIGALCCWYIGKTPYLVIARCRGIAAVYPVNETAIALAARVAVLSRRCSNLERKVSSPPSPRFHHIDQKLIQDSHRHESYGFFYAIRQAVLAQYFTVYLICPVVLRMHGLVRSNLLSSFLLPL